MSTSTPADRSPARSDADAKARLLKVLGRSLSTVSTQGLWRVGPAGRGGAYIAFTVPEVLPLRAGQDRIYLRSSIQYRYGDDPRFEGERKAFTERYAHTVGLDETLKPELYSWEWASDEPRYPHLHVRRSDPAFHGLGKLHLPTGRVFFEDVIRFLIDEHEVEHQRDDWDEVLGESWRRVTAWSTWGGRKER